MLPDLHSAPTKPEKGTKNHPTNIEKKDQAHVEKKDIGDKKPSKPEKSTRH